MTAAAPSDIAEEDRQPSATLALPEPDTISTSGFALFIDRALSLVCLASLVPAAASAYEVAGDLDRFWLMAVGGGLTASAALMPVYAWSRRGIRPLALLFSAALLAGVLTWPLAWQSQTVAPSAPPASFLFGLAVVLIGVVAGRGVAGAYGAALAVGYFLVRLSPAGGGATPLLAAEDVLLAVVGPLVVLMLIKHVRELTVDLDAVLARRHAETADAAINQALVAERRRLDAIVHDEVMTTLVAAAQTGEAGDAHLVAQARQALASLDAEEADADGDAPVSADRLVRLVKDITASVCPRAEVVGEIPGAAVTVPQPVARALLQATREAALNAERHSGAAHVQVLVAIAPAGRRLNVRISVSDDGSGFDPDAVPDERLGVRLSLAGRMEAAGGRAEVLSAPGRGTTVRLSWSGDRVRSDGPRPRSIADVSRHPLFEAGRRRPFGAVLLGLSAVYGLAALLGVEASEEPLALVAAVALLIAGAGVAAYTLRRMPLSAPGGVVLAACMVGASVLGMVGLRQAGPLGLTWLAAGVALLGVAAFALGRPGWAVVGALAHAGVVWRLADGDWPPVPVAVAAALPLGWVVLAALAFAWLDAVWSEVADAERSAEQAARLNAASFSKQVLREVWLAELRGQVVPVLEDLIAGRMPQGADRASLLLLEGTLRDGIKAANFNSPALASAIMAARRRGVTVTLVDNRGSRLPEPVRRATLRALEDAVRSAQSGRVVARTAPAGYAEAVTIVQVAREGRPVLTRITEDGATVTGGDHADEATRGT